VPEEMETLGTLILTEFVPTLVTLSVAAEEVTATFVGGTKILYELGATVVFTAAPEATSVALEPAATVGVLTIKLG
jgi:hypothetical protein